MKNTGAADTTPSDEAPGGKPMTFWEHLDELRRRLIWSVVAFFIGCLVAWEFHERILALLVEPFAAAWRLNNLPGDPSLHFGAPAAAFVAYFKLAMIGGAGLAAPIIFYELWAFVAPGLYAREKRYVIPFVLLSTTLFLGGGYFGWRAAFPLSFRYFLSLSGAVGSEHVAVMPTVMMGEYIEFCAQMLLGFGVVFEIPMLLLFLSISGLINYLTLIQYGRWFVLGAFIIAAFLTPPDVASQLTMAIPMCLLYGVSIGLVWAFGKPPTAEQRQAYKHRKKPRPAVPEGG
jgi:sec-independent protein translocase protein TatC